MESFSSSALFQLTVGEDPIVAAALHDGHVVRDEVARALHLTGTERRREEEPHTGFLTEVAATRIVACRSRYEVDLDRPRDVAVYRSPEEAWGRQVWKSPVSEALVARSQDEYDLFYATVHNLLPYFIARFGRVVILDLHSYNHRRQGPNGPFADPKYNPAIDVGTKTLDRRRWGPLVDRFIADLRSYPTDDQPLDVRENVKFEGGHFARDIHAAFSPLACVLTVEVRKSYMDEWTGSVDRDQLETIAQALESTLPGLREESGRATAVLPGRDRGLVRPAPRGTATDSPLPTRPED